MRGGSELLVVLHSTRVQGDDLPITISTHPCSNHDTGVNADNNPNPTQIHATAEATHRRQPLKRRSDAASEPAQERFQLRLCPGVRAMQPLSEDAYRLIRQAPAGTHLKLNATP